MNTVIKAVFRIRIHRIHVLLGLPDPDPLAKCMDPDPDPSIRYFFVPWVRYFLYMPIYKIYFNFYFFFVQRKKPVMSELYETVTPNPSPPPPRPGEVKHNTGTGYCMHIICDLVTTEFFLSSS